VIETGNPCPGFIIPKRIRAFQVKAIEYLLFDPFPAGIGEFFFALGASSVILPGLNRNPGNLPFDGKPFRMRAGFLPLRASVKVNQFGGEQKQPPKESEQLGIYQHINPSFSCPGIGVNELY
jgi:hypothetical protein